MLYKFYQFYQDLFIVLLKNVKGGLILGSKVYQVKGTDRREICVNF